MNYKWYPNNGAWEKKILNLLIKKFVVLELSRPSKFTFGEALTALNLNNETMIFFFLSLFCLLFFYLFVFNVIMLKVRINRMNLFFILFACLTIKKPARKRLEWSILYEVPSACITRIRFHGYILSQLRHPNLIFYFKIS